MSNPKVFLTGIDLAKSPLNNAVIQNLATAPSSPVVGQIYYDTTVLQTLQWNGTAWVWKATDTLNLGGQLPSYYLNRANHTGTQLAATISDLASTVQGYRLDQFAAPTNPVNFNGQRITNVGTPTSSTDAANKAYIDALVTGQDPKPSANWATNAALPTNTYANGTAGVGATITASANGVLTVDGGTPALQDRILVKNEATSAYWGLYVLTQLGTGSAPFILTRDVTMDQATEFGGALIPVEAGGTANGNGLFLFSAPESITVGTTSLAITKINSSTSLSGSTSILISGNTASVIVDPAGGIVIGASGIKLDTTKAVQKYAQTFGDGSSTSFTITHNLGTQDVEVSVYQAGSPFAEVECDVQHTSASQITLAFTNIVASNAYRVVVHG